MKTFALAVLFLLVLPGCGLFQPRPVEFDPTPVMLALRAELDQGKIDYATFQEGIRKELKVAVTDIRSSTASAWEATAPAVTKSVVDAVKGEIKANPPPVGKGIPEWLLWVVSIAGVGVSAGAANVALKGKKVTAPAPGVAPVAVAAGGVR